MARTKRSDVHRVGAIVPADYEIVLSYSCGSSAGPSMGLNCEAELVGFEPCPKCVPGRTCAGPHKPIMNKHVEGLGCCVAGLKKRGEKFAEHGGGGKCTACGACYVYGDVWRHTSGEHIHVGHQCARKYELLADRSAFEIELGRRKQAHAVAVQRALNEEKRGAVLSANPGLEAALETKHHIVADIRARFVQYCSLSPAQIALVLKLANEVNNPTPAKEGEAKVAAPTGRQTFRGVVVSVKEQVSDWGVVEKMTVKVQTPAGIWLAWGTAPQGLRTECRMAGVKLHGAEIELTATLQRGRDAHFVFAKRPVGSLVSPIRTSESE
jgi:hypothetical protein